MVHFIVIGAAIFAIHAYATSGLEPEAPRDRIVVTPGRVVQLAHVFARTWQRPPRREELSELVNAFVKEELYYREAIKRGLDRDDTLVRRRMQQKMEFLTEPGDDVLTATNADLEAFLLANRADFRVEPKITYEQIFIDPVAAGSSSEARAEKLLEQVRNAPADADFSQFGDATLLPSASGPVSLSLVERHFGKAFANQILELPGNTWTGPISSTYGLHLVRITNRIDGYDPPLSDVRKAVELRWRDARRDAYRKAEYKRLLDKYEVVLPERLVAAETAERQK